MMRGAIFSIVVILAVVCSGCSTIQESPNQRAKSSTQGQSGDSQRPYECKSDPCSNDEVTHAIGYALDRCTDSQNLYERRGFYSKSGQLAVAVLGSLAGAVAAPIAKGSSSKAWAGLSGASNGIQAQLAEKFADELIVQERAAVRDAMTRGQEHIRQAPTKLDQIIEAEMMESDCRQAAVAADAAAYKGVASAASTAASDNQKLIEATQAQIKQARVKATSNDGLPASAGSAPPPAGQIPTPTVKPATGH